MTGRLLITGFGPFPGVPVNPSGDLARRVGALSRMRRIPGGPPEVLVLRTAYDAIPDLLVPALAQRPAAILMIGVALRSTRPRVEFRARNRASRLFPDAAGRISARLSLDPDGPAQRRSPHARAALARLRRQGVVAIPSRDAGRYLCNAAYYRALAAGCPVLFLHIPPFPKPGRSRKTGRARRRSPVEALAEAVAEVALVLLRRSGG